MQSSRIRARVGAGTRTISLRILGTEQAKDELASLGEDVEDFVVQTASKIDETVKAYTAVALNQFKGVSLLDDNGNYRGYPMKYSRTLPM